VRRWPDQAPSRRDAGGGRAPGIVDFKGPLTQGYDPMSSSSTPAPVGRAPDRAPSGPAWTRSAAGRKPPPPVGGDLMIRDYAADNGDPNNYQ